MINAYYTCNKYADLIYMLDYTIYMYTEQRNSLEETILADGINSEKVNR